LPVYDKYCTCVQRWDRDVIVSNYFYCRIRREGLLCDAERDLTAIAKFLVNSAAKT